VIIYQNMHVPGTSGAGPFEKMLVLDLPFVPAAVHFMKLNADRVMDLVIPAAGSRDVSLFLGIDRR
jgi:hypothetical protein